MSSINVMDASAILAYLQQERGHELVEAALDAGVCWVTSVNYCEALSKLSEKSMPIEQAKAAVRGLGLVVIDFDEPLAEQAAAIRVKTMPIGASLGDRACLALAEQIANSKDTAVVYTTDQLWTKLKWPFKVVVIRHPKTTK